MTDENAAGNETQYHLELSPGDIRGPVLLPGDPDRLSTITGFWETAAEVANHREFRTVSGTVGNTAIAATSTGIGSPSAAIAVEELANIGVDTLIRVGSCGAIQPGISLGDLIITTGAVRQEGTSHEYVRETYPAVAHHRVVTALISAADELGYPYHVGITCSTDSFYSGQNRSGHGGYTGITSEEQFKELQQAGVLNYEMETSAILTLASLFGMRAGAVCAVYANRTSGEFAPRGEDRAAETAAKAVEILADMDGHI